MAFSLDEARAVLERTPATLDALLRGLPDAWIHAREGPDAWSPYDVVGHLLHGEKTDWIARAEIIRTEGESRPFDPFDRFAMFEDSKGKTLGDLLDGFAALRARNLATLRSWNLQPEDFARRGTHPALGAVTLGQLLATWAAHDLSHLRQITRTMAKRYAAAVGPWAAYLPVMAE